MKNKIFLISDAHIKSRLWTNNSLVTGDSYEALHLIQEHLDLYRGNINEHRYLLSCGDLFDAMRPTSRDLYEVCNFIKNFDKVYYIDGNHDRTDPSLLQMWSDRCVKLTSSPVAIGDLIIYGISYCTTQEDFNHQLSMVRADRESRSEHLQPVILMHQALKEFLGFDGSYISSCDQIMSVVGQDFKIYCGDIHDPQVFKPKYGSGFVCSPGPLVPQDIGQSLKEQYYYELSDITGDFNKVKIKVRDITICDSLEKFNNALASEASDNSILTPLVYAVLPVGVNIPKLTEEQKANKIIIIRRASADSSKLIKHSSSTTSLTLKEAINQDIQETQKKPAKLIALTNVLMDAEKPDEVLLTLLKKLGVINDSSSKT